MRYLVKSKFIYIFIPIVFIILGETVFPQTLYNFRTRNLSIIYPDPNQYYLVPHLASCFENSFNFHKKLFDYNQTENVSILFHDFGDYGYGGAISIPFNLLIIGIEPFDFTFDFLPLNERMNMLMNHELTHITELDKPNKTDIFFRNIFFGKPDPIAEDPISMIYSYLTSPRRYSPRWYHEGIAVFMETWMSGGMGRGLGGYDEMVFRTMVKDSSYFYDVVGLESEGTTIDFQTGANSYFYGARFFNYLGYKFGPEKIFEWVKRTDSSHAFFANQFEQVFYNSLEEEWTNWIKFEKNWQKKNLDTINKFPITGFKDLYQNPMGSVSRAFYSSSKNKLYFAMTFPGELAKIIEFDIQSGKYNKIADMPNCAKYLVASLAYDDSSEILFYTTNNSDNWRTINALDIKTGKTKILLENCRIGDIAFNKKDKSLWGIRHHNGISTLVKIPYPYLNYNLIYTLPYGQEFFDLDISQDGEKMSCSFTNVTGKQKLVILDLNSITEGNRNYQDIYEFEGNTASNFVFSKDGRYLFGTSYYTGVSNIFRYDFSTKKMEALTNTETGFFRPIPFTNDSLMAFRYSGKGFIPVSLRIRPIDDINAVSYLGQAVIEKHPELEKWNIGSPTKINIDSLKTYSGEYNTINNLKLSSIYPVIEGYKEFPSYGLSIDFHEPFYLCRLKLKASYSPNKLLKPKERFHSQITFTNWYWEFIATYNKSDFYDLFGPTKVSRSGYSLMLKYNKILIDETPLKTSFFIKGSFYGDLETLPDYQNVSASFDKFLTGSFGYNYTYLRKSLGGIEDEAGFSLEAISQNNYVNNKLYPRIYSNVSFGFLTPIPHSSIWLRGSAGKSFGDRNEPFANFYFGGFGNNYIDYQNAQRFREYYSFPGIELNECGGTVYSKFQIEWILPHIRFKKFGFLNFYFNWAKLALFSSVLSANFDNTNFSRTLFNLGSQLDFRLVLFSNLESILSFGYAIASEKEKKLSDEFLISLKLLK